MKRNKQNGSPSFYEDGLGGLLWGVGATAWLAAIFSLVSCPKPLTKVPTYEEAARQAQKDAPFVTDTIEKRNKLQGCDDKPKVLKKNVANGVPHTGLLITNRKAACLVAQRAERDRLRKDIATERLRARTKQIVNDAAKQRLAELAKRSWWEKHKLSVLAPALLTIGGVLVIAVMYCLTGGKPINVSATPHVQPLR